MKETLIIDGNQLNLKKNQGNKIQKMGFEKRNFLGFQGSYKKNKMWRFNLGVLWLSISFTDFHDNKVTYNKYFLRFGILLQ